MDLGYNIGDYVEIVSATHRNFGLRHDHIGRVAKITNADIEDSHYQFGVDLEGTLGVTWVDVSDIRLHSVATHNLSTSDDDELLDYDSCSLTLVKTLFGSTPGWALQIYNMDTEESRIVSVNTAEINNALAELGVQTR